ncbi:MAG: sulfatase-like hydrolase/transferase [Clostridiales bacterium]|nr:sulfatase-like hydrolase/transferase [Clostridiales bacterium]
MPGLPNILWLCSDQQRWDTINALGNSCIDTPNLDRLCSEGTALTCAYAQNPVCTPSRASFLSGKYPSAINSNILGGTNLPEHCTLITKALADEGYCCGNIGKLHITTAWGGTERRGDDGYSEFIYSLGSGHDLENGCSAYREWLDGQGIPWQSLFTNDGKHDYYWYRDDAPVDLRQTAWCAHEAISFMERHRDEPWMLSVNWFDPHPPYDAPKEYVEKYLSRDLPEPVFSDYDYYLGDVLKNVKHQTRTPKAPDDDVRRKKASYYGMCEIVDRHVGWILDALDRLGLRENTLVIYTSDHGEMLGDHGLCLKGCRFYDGAVRVPLIFSMPGTVRSGFVTDTLAELTDIAPTIAELCGISFTDVHGHSLVPLLSNSPDREYSPRKFVRSEYCDSNKADTMPPTYATMYRDERYKLVVYHTADFGELYDMKNDPQETHNLWEEESAMPLKFDLMKRSFDSSVIMSRPGQVRVARY